MPAAFLTTVCTTIRWNYKVELLGNISANMDLEDHCHLWSNSGQLHLVETPTIQVLVTSSYPYFWARAFKNCILKHPNISKSLSYLK